MNNVKLSNKIFDLNGYRYSSFDNLSLFNERLNNDKIYEKYCRILRQIFLYCKKQKDIALDKNFKEILFEKFRYRIEKFCMVNFYVTHPSVFIDTFNRTVHDIFFKLKLIKIN